VDHVLNRAVGLKIIVDMSDCDGLRSKTESPFCAFCAFSRPNFSADI
jgi:hypothetical protein